jgi:hypothetical protein
VKTLPVYIMGYLVAGLWLQITLSVICATKKIFVCALSLWCYKPVQSMAHHFVAFTHHVRFNILKSVTLKKTVVWNLQPAVWYSCTDLPDCMASHPRFIFVVKLLCRHLTKLLGCNNIPLQGLYMTIQTHKWQRHTTSPQVEFKLTVPVFEKYKTVQL